MIYLSFFTSLRISTTCFDNPPPYHIYSTCRQFLSPHSPTVTETLLSKCFPPYYLCHTSVLLRNRTSQVTNCFTCSIPWLYILTLAFLFVTFSSNIKFVFLTKFNFFIFLPCIFLNWSLVSAITTENLI